MKKVSYILLVICLSLFIGTQNVDAGSKTIKGNLHTSNETRDKYKYSINLFEETYNQTKFANFLYENGKNFVSKFSEIYNISSTTLTDGNAKISIFAYEDLKYVTSFRNYYQDSGLSSFYIRNHFEDFSEIFNYLFVDNSPYINRVYLDGYSYVNISKLVFIGQNNSSSSMTIRYGDQDILINFYADFIFLFNDVGEHIGYIEFIDNDIDLNSANYHAFNFSFPLEDKKNPDMTSWYAYNFRLPVYSDTTDGNYYGKVYPENFYLDSNEPVTITENAGYSGVSGWFKNLTSKYQELSEYNIRFVYDEIFYNQGDLSYFNLYDYWLDDNSFEIPSNYKSTDITISKKGDYLVPKAYCSYDDYKLYYSSTTNVSVYGFYLNYYLYDPDDSISNLNIFKKFAAFSSKAYVNYSYDPLKELSVDKTEFLNYAINVYPYSTRYSIYIYYNPACYSLTITTGSNDKKLEFDSGTYTLTTSEITSNYNNDTVNGSNYNWGSTSMSGSTSNGDVTNGNIISGEVFEDTKFSDIISNVGTYASNFVDSISALVGLATIFLVGLPAEIYQVLIAIFTIGLIVILIKLIH